MNEILDFSLTLILVIVGGFLCLLRAYYFYSMKSNKKTIRFNDYLANHMFDLKYLAPVFVFRKGDSTKANNFRTKVNIITFFVYFILLFILFESI